MKLKFNLAAILQDIVNENPEQNLLSNSYFRIPKNNPEFLEKYKFLKYSNSRQIAIIVILLTVPRIILKLIIEYFGSLLFSRQYKYFKIKHKVDGALFISHATNNNLSGTTDLYFANLPIIIGKQKSTILYLNHNKYHYKDNLAKVRQKVNCENALLMPKFLRPTEFTGYLHHCFGLIKTQVKISNKYRQYDSFKSLITIYAIQWIFSRESYNNYLINQRTKEINKQIRIDMVFLTLEGHSYEEIVAKLIKSKNKKAKVFFYQHSPITKAQKGVEFLLRNLKYPVTVLTTGPTYSRFLSSFSDLANTICIGSNKINKLQPNLFTEIETILVAPEGTTSASNEFIHYLIRTVGKYQNYSFILRLHPNLKFTFSTALLKLKLSKLKNVQISERTLLEDLKFSQATFYRSSTVALETLKIRNIPIYIDFHGNLDLDVYSVVEKKFPVLSINEHNLDLVKSIKINELAFEVIDELYLPLNIPDSLVDYIHQD